MEENMQAVGGILGNLKSMATDMGAEIEKQNSQLDRINDKVHKLLFYFKTMLTVRFLLHLPAKPSIISKAY